MPSRQHVFSRSFRLIHYLTCLYVSLVLIHNCISGLLIFCRHIGVNNASSQALAWLGRAGSLLLCGIFPCKSLRNHRTSWADRSIFPQRTIHLSLEKHGVGSVNEWKKNMHTEKRLFIQRNWTLFHNMEELALVQNTIIRHVLFSINCFQVIFLKSVPLHINPNVSR